MNTRNYSDIRNDLENLPETWCPALLFTLVKTCVRKKVFQPGGLEHIVKRAQEEENATQENNKV